MDSKQSCTKPVQYSNDIAYLLSVDHSIMHCSEHRIGLKLFGFCVLIFFSSVVALRCRISVAVCGSNFRRMRHSARVTDNGCGPNILYLHARNSMQFKRTQGHTNVHIAFTKYLQSALVQIQGFLQKAVFKDVVVSTNHTHVPWIWLWHIYSECSCIVSFLITCKFITTLSNALFLLISCCCDCKDNHGLSFSNHDSLVQFGAYHLWDYSPVFNLILETEKWQVIF